MDPRHFQVAVTARELDEIAARIGDEEGLSIVDSQPKGHLDRKFETVVGRLHLTAIAASAGAALPPR